MWFRAAPRRYAWALVIICATATFGYAGSARPHEYLFGTSESTFSPTVHVIASYQLSHDLTGKVQFALYRLSLSQAQALLTGGWDRREPYADGTTRDVAVFTATAFTQRQGYSTGHWPFRRWAKLDDAYIDAGAQPRGVYAMALAVGDRSDVQIIFVTSLGIIAQPVAGAELVYAVDLESFRRFGAGVDLVAPTSERRISDDLWLVRSPPAIEAIMATSGRGDVAWVQSYGGEGLSAETGFVQTDRPLYRPGDSIHIRGVLRTGSIASYAVSKGYRTVTVVDPNGGVIFRARQTLSAFGSISISARLPDDAATGEYTVDVGPVSTFVEVMAYKKPEYSIHLAAPSYVVGGDTVHLRVSSQYFFGRPAAGIAVHYEATLSPFTYFWQQEDVYSGWFTVSGPEGSENRTVSGDALTDAQGNVTFDVPTSKQVQASAMDIEVDARDASGRTVSDEAGITVAPGTFFTDIVPSRWYDIVGEPLTLNIAADRYDGKPASHMVLHIGFQRLASRAKDATSVVLSEDDETVTTDDKGIAKIVWSARDPGPYEVVVTGRDERGDTIAERLPYWIASANQALPPNANQVTLVPERRVVAPGQKLRMVVLSSAVGRDALLVMSTDTLAWAKVIRLQHNTTELAFNAPRRAAYVDVSIALPDESGTLQSETDFAISPVPMSLNIQLHPEKRQYEPGQPARVDVVARDQHGRAVSAEIGIGIVDEALYELDPDELANVVVSDLYDAWSAGGPEPSWHYPHSPMLSFSAVNEAAYAPRVVTIAHVTSNAAGLIRPGIGGDLYNVNAATGNGGRTIEARVRSTFLDTAYWAPAVVTDEHGRASVSFRWPDNVTTWRATAIGITRATQVGSAQRDMTVTKDFIARLEVPRFLRNGDRSTAIGIVNGVPRHPNVRMHLDPGTLGDAAFTGPLRLDSNATTSAAWPLRANSVGASTLTLAATDGIDSDAMRLQIPLEGASARTDVRDAGFLANTATLRISLPPGAEPGSLRLSLAPSIAARLAESVRFLEVYPYDCTEQTASAALSAVAVAEALGDAGDRDAEILVDARATARDAVAQLLDLEHGDGSWGWWENDPAHPFMTAYAVYTLARLRDAGYMTNAWQLERGAESLASQLAVTNNDTLRFWGGRQPGSEWNTRAFMLFALASADRKRVPPATIRDAAHHARQLNSYALAVLGLAALGIGDDVTARALLADLDARAISNGSFVYWSGQTWDYAWEDDPIETTAYALRLEQALAPASPRIPEIIAFLVTQQRGGWWYTTKDTAAAVDAIANAVPTTVERVPNEAVRVTLDGRPVRTLHITQPVLNAAETNIVFPATEIQNGATITLTRSGSGSLYWSSDESEYVPPSATITDGTVPSFLGRLFHVPSLSVSRSYDVGHPGPWHVGDSVVVTLIVRANEAADYVAIEDPFPAGVEYAPEQGELGWMAWSTLRLLDDRASYFIDHLAAHSNMTIRYTLRATTPGTYAAPPPTVYAVYGPPVAAEGNTQRVTIVGNP